MKQKEFDKLAVELFGQTLVPHGFTNEGSQCCTFHRKISAYIYNVIIPDMGSRGVWFDVKVAPVSPKLDPLFELKYPDDIGMFTSNLLSKYDGVGITQQQFNCKYEENFRRIYKKEVEPLLLEKAIPFLDGIRTLQDLLPLIRHDLMRGLALAELGEFSAAKQVLEAQRQNFAGRGEPDIVTTVKYLDKILASLPG